MCKSFHGQTVTAITRIRVPSTILTPRGDICEREMFIVKKFHYYHVDIWHKLCGKEWPKIRVL